MKVKTSFVSEDGVEFQTREECARHEEMKSKSQKYEWGVKYFTLLCEINYIKHVDGGKNTFKGLERILSQARDAYRTAKEKGIAGSKSYRFEKLTELRSNYVYAKNLLKKAREEYKKKRKDLETLGVRLGFRKPYLRATKTTAGIKQ